MTHQSSPSFFSASGVAMDEVVDRTLAMKELEATSYNYHSYFEEDSLIGCALVAEGSNENSCSSGNGTSPALRLHVSWREKIVTWSYNVVDHFDLSREVVAISLDLFDRYLATRGNDCTGSFALLTSLTTLHIAIKVHDAKKVKLTTLANLSRGQFQSKDIQEMEWKILAALKWRLHPPTQYSFVSHILQFLPKEVNGILRKDILELSRYLTELAVCDSYFVGEKSSTISFAAILNVMDEINYARLSAGIREKFLRDLSSLVGLYTADPEVQAARERLRAMLTATTSGYIHSKSNGVASVLVRPDSSSDIASLSSAGSNCSNFHSRPRANSGDSSSCCRYSPSPRVVRRCVSNVSPIVSAAAVSRARHSASPVVAGVQ